MIFWEYFLCLSDMRKVSPRLDRGFKYVPGLHSTRVMRIITTYTNGRETKIRVYNDPEDDFAYELDNNLKHMDEPITDRVLEENGPRIITINQANMPLSDVRKQFGDDIANAVRDEFWE